MFNYASVQNITKLLTSRNMAPQKKFGQNFMVHEATKKRFIEYIPTRNGGSGQDGQAVWEIGPGIGAISAPLLTLGARLRVFEIDRGFIEILHDLFAAEIKSGKLVIVRGDARKTCIQQTEHPSAIIGNLPYNIASGMVSLLITQGFADTPMVFTLQKEVVERICAGPGERIYGSLSILCQYAMGVENLGTLSPGLFFPVPEVDSGILRLLPSPAIPKTQELKTLETLLNLLFHSRRKTIHNNIRQSSNEKFRQQVFRAVQEAEIDPGRRAESLAVDDYRRIVGLI
ncbi:MAG: 16S rRNA (adenine(1518)-N(6)/adenine(1519)-N(6))-dimethyltransferase RsmA [Salinispira sp.]